MNKKIAEAIETLGIEKKNIYTMGEMDAICKEARCSLREVMYYLRHVR